MKVKILLANTEYKVIEDTNIDYKKGDDIILDNVKFHITDVATLLDEDGTETKVIYISRELLLG